MAWAQSSVAAARALSSEALWLSSEVRRHRGLELFRACGRRMAPGGGGRGWNGRGDGMENQGETNGKLSSFKDPPRLSWIDLLGCCCIFEGLGEVARRRRLGKAFGPAVAVLVGDSEHER